MWPLAAVEKRDVLYSGVQEGRGLGSTEVEAKGAERSCMNRVARHTWSVRGGQRIKERTLSQVAVRRKDA